MNDENGDEFTDVEYLDEYMPSRSFLQIPNTIDLLAILCTFFSFIVYRMKTILQLMQSNRENVGIIDTLREQNRRLKISIRSTVMKHRVNVRKNLDNFKKLFNDDQLDIIKRQLKRPAEWSDETILKGLQTKFACKKEGYNYLLREGYPLPSIVTLRKKLQGLDFQPGILNEVFFFMKEKVKSFSTQDKECQLVIDEMSIVEGRQYNIGIQSFVGDITIPLAKSKLNQEASHLLVYLIRGLSSNYKQIVGYDCTGNSTNPKCLKNKILEIVKKSEEIGLRCNGLTADLGPSNTAVWKLWGIRATRKRKQIVNSIVHPCDPLRKFWIIPDVPHLLKRAVQGILNNRIVNFDNYIVKEFELPGNTVNSSDFFELFEAQKNDQLKLAPKLKKHVLSPNNFQKMNVPTSTALIGSNVSTGLLFLHTELHSATLKQNSSYQSTAWFCQILSRWFNLMSSRHFVLSIREANYDELETELQEFIEIVRHTKFGDGKWKPFQRGLLLSTMSILEMSQYLLKEKKFDFVLPGRLTQDCLENLFSNVRHGNPKPNALQVQHSIKSIAISQYLQLSGTNNTSYTWDDATYLKDFLKIVTQARENNDELSKQAFEKDQRQLKD